MSVAGFLKPESGIPGYGPAPMYSTNGETFGAMYDMMRTNFNQDAAWRMTGDEYYARNELIKKRFGRDLVAEIRKEAPEAGADYLVEELPKRADAAIMEGRKTAPERWKDIKTNAEVEEAAREKARASRQQFSDVASRNTNGISKSLSIFGGAIAGGFTDPLNIATIPFGAGASRGIFKAALIEGGLNAAVETAAVPFVKEWQNDLGYHYGFSEAAADVGTAFVGGAALTSVLRGIVPAARATAHYAGSISRVMFDRIAGIEGLPQSVRNAAAYMSRVAHIDESAIPGTVKTDADLMAHREKLQRTAEDFESYRKPTEEPSAREETLTPRQEEAIARAVDKKTEEVKAEVNTAIADEFLTRANEIKAQLQESAVIDLSTPASMKKHLGYTPESLSQFIKRTGGIQEYSGELANRGITSKSMPGLVRKAKEDKGAALMDVGESPSSQSADYVKERAWEEGYFPDKSDWREIDDSELYDAIAADVQGRKIYKEADQERIAVLSEQSGFANEYDRMGITGDMTPEEIASALRDFETSFDNIADVASSDSVPPLQRMEVDISPPDAYTAARARFDEMMKQDEKLKVTLEDGTQITLKDLSARLGEDLNAIEAMTKCRLA